MRSIFRKKSIDVLIRTAHSHKSLQKTLGAVDLVLLGIGCTIGTGIFVLTGQAAAEHAGPAIAISYFLAGLVCVFAGLAYTELASLIPVAGSAYTYSYSIIGEFVAWLVAWGLVLEYTVGASTVAVGWSGYLVGILEGAGVHLPKTITKSAAEGGIVNLPAVCVSLCIGLLLMRGTRESAIVNRILVGIKLVVICIFVGVAAPHIKMENYAEFAPFGVNGIIMGAAAIFFAFIGFDAVATAAEEAKDPNRTLPIGIIGSLLICALLYVIVCLALTGITHYSKLNTPEPMAFALRENGSNIGSFLVGSGAIFGMFAVLLVMMYAQSRIFFVMSRDGLIPQKFSKLHSKFQTPYLSCIITMFAVMIISGFVPLRTLGHMTSLGTLLAFAVASLCALILRVKRPDIKREFKCPAIFFVAPVAIISCSLLIYELLLHTGKYFAIWIAISVVVYFTYAYKRSPLKYASEKQDSQQ